MFAVPVLEVCVVRRRMTLSGSQLKAIAGSDRCRDQR
jgi:hypothetical protein